MSSLNLDRSELAFRDVSNKLDFLKNIDANLDDLLVLDQDAIDSINEVMPNLPDVNVLARANELISNLSVTSEEVGFDESSSAVLDGTDIHLKLSKGVPGANGDNGLTPTISFNFNSTTGDIDYVIDYQTTTSELTGQLEGEW
jgi:hypothetical protein